MFPDPVVNEVRQHGAKIAEECQGDVHRMAERLRREQQSNGRVVVDRSRIDSTPSSQVDSGDNK